jgi:hypothetical protein
MTIDKTVLQLKREQQSQDAGYKKFLKAEDDNRKHNNGSATSFGLMLKKYMLGPVILNLHYKINAAVGENKKDIAQILTRLGLTQKDHLFSIEEAAFIGIQLALVTALNPNTMPAMKELSRAGGDKKLLVKKTLPELQAQIGKVIHKQIQLKLIQKTFPDFFRKANEHSRRPFKDGATASTSYWEMNLFRSIRRYADELRKQGLDHQADIIENRKQLSYHEEMVIGSLVLSSVLSVCNQYITITKGNRRGRNTTEIVLTSEGRMKEQEIRSYVASYSHDLLPMLTSPVPVTNDNLGGWLMDSLQQPERSYKGSIHLSEKHLEFINRQARVGFQINPFIHALMEELCERQWELGKFHYQMLEEPIKISAELGYSHLDPDEQNLGVSRDPRTKELRRRNTAIHARNAKRLKGGLIAHAIKEKAAKILHDEVFYIPMKYDSRGRIYSRVPFISFQSNDAGRYLIRFSDKTPTDDRTEHWMKVGISNAAGNDKLCWEKRIQWFDKNRDEIINVGRMVSDGDFKRAYDFLTKDRIEDPFCLAALANEYVKVFVDKTHEYTQCFVCVDASCSGTSIFNAWRRNLTGASKTNLVDTDSPADIYTEVWLQIKALASEGTFRADHIKRLEKSKLIRKMMKAAYVPAQYASPTSEQKNTLRRFNRDVLKKARMEFTDEELKVLQELWVVALDEVSSISTVVNWFKERSRECLKQDSVIKYITSNGSIMTLRYPKSKLKKVQVFGYGSAQYKASEPCYTRQNVAIETDEVDTRKLLNAVTANVTHATDAAALCEALWDWNVPFVAIHDACGLPPSQLLDQGVMRLKEGLITATHYDVWSAFRSANNLPHNATTSGPVIGDLVDWDAVRKSKYLYS